MTSFLLTWNSKEWAWDSLDTDILSCCQNQYFDRRWACISKNSAKVKDRVFLMTLGPIQPSGIIASGRIMSAPFQDRHFSRPDKTAWYVNVRFDTLLNPKKDNILRRDLLEKIIPSGHWTPQASGTSIKPDAASELEVLWAKHISSIEINSFTIPEEIINPERYCEGSLQTIFVNAFERDIRARKACIDFHGTNCVICGTNFESVYGEIGKGFIHVHHLKPLSEIRKTYQINPKDDLIPVCPNCHAMIHKRKSPLLPQELKIRMVKNSDVPGLN